jgi:hypothetical protein
VLAHDDRDRGPGRPDLAGQATALSSSGRVTARVEIFSAKILVMPAARRESVWVSSDWRAVEARALDWPLRRGYLLGCGTVTVQLIFGFTPA